MRRALSRSGARHCSRRPCFAARRAATPSSAARALSRAHIAALGDQCLPRGRARGGDRPRLRIRPPQDRAGAALAPIAATSGQIAHERRHLMRKLAVRSRAASPVARREDPGMPSDFPARSRTGCRLGTAMNAVIRPMAKAEFPPCCDSSRSTGSSRTSPDSTRHASTKELERCLPNPRSAAAGSRGPGMTRSAYLIAVYVFSLEHLGLTAEIDEFFVLPSFRGREIGSELLQVAETEFIRRKCTNVSLQLGREKRPRPRLLPRERLQRPRGFRIAGQDAAAQLTEARNTPCPRSHTPRRSTRSRGGGVPLRRLPPVLRDARGPRPRPPLPQRAIPEQGIGDHRRPG